MTDTATIEKTEAEKTTETIGIVVPVDFKTFLENQAKENNLSTAAYCRNALASFLNFDLPDMPTRVKGGVSDEERKRRAKEKAKEKNQLVAAVMRLLENGTLTKEQLGLTGNSEDKAA